MVENVKIRRMCADDLDRIVEIEAGVYGEHHWPKSSFFEELSNDFSRYYVLFDKDNKLVGYAGCWHILEECHITNIAVDKDFHRRKYGEILLKTVIDGCYKEKVKYITLEVRASNEPAIKMYEKYGFTSFGKRKGYYQDNNEDAYIMWTKNIFFDEFKSIYDKVTKDLANKVLVEQ